MPNVRSQKIVINDIKGGFASTFHGQGASSTYLQSYGIDPDFQVSVSYPRLGGAITPNTYSKFSSTNIGATSGYVVAIITQPKTTTEYVYVVLSSGELISYSATLGSETVVGTVAGDNAVGATYYNNYIYIFGTGASKDDVSRYGPLNNSPTLVDNVWKGATLGSQTALTNTNYPMIGVNSYRMPNHWGYVHIDGSLYFFDYKDGKGYLHRIKTKKTTNEGDTNDGTLYGALVLPLGYIPTSLTGYGADLAIGLSLNLSVASPKLNAGQSEVIFWDTFSDSFYNTASVPDPLITAMLTKNNEVFIFSGNSQFGTRLSKFLGGRSVGEVSFFELSWPPFCGAIDVSNNRVIFSGNYTENDVTAPQASVVFSYGSKNSRLPDVIHCPIRTTSTGTNPQITALKYIFQSSNQRVKPIVAWVDGTTKGIDKYLATANATSMWQSNFYHIGSKFVVRELKICLGSSVEATTEIQPYFYVDSVASSSGIPYIDGTYLGKFNIVKKNPKMALGTTEISGWNNISIGFIWTTTPTTILSVEITLDVYDDELSS